MSPPRSITARTPRQAAAAIVRAWLESGEFPDRLFRAVPERRAAVMEMAYGTIRWHRTLDWVRARFAPRRPPPGLDAILLVGLYELLFMDDVQDYAAVNEAVEAARAEGGRKGAGLVNALLRRAQAERPALLPALEKEPPGIRFSHPDVLVDRWTRHFGREATLRLCRSNNRRPEVVIRVNAARCAGRDLLAALRQARVEATPHGFDPDRFFILPRGASVAALPGYAEGWFSVQDPATALAPGLLAPRPGERVLDACAAPGGKTAILAEAMEGEGAILAADASVERIGRLQENLVRLGAGAVRVARADAARPETLRAACEKAGLPGTFHAVLLDVPCTNTGVLCRRPDARWRFSREHLQKAAAKQRAILDGAAGLLEAGGRIVYSTCSLEPEENEGQVSAWLDAHDNFTLAQSKTLFPPDSDTDGAYAALLVRG